MGLLKEQNFITAKGSVLTTAILAGVMAVKRTSDLIPLCHPLAIDDCNVLIVPSSENEMAVECCVTVSGKTGVEMEALVGASIAALTLYDMCKALSHDITLRETRLVAKSGGKRDIHERT